MKQSTVKVLVNDVEIYVNDGSGSDGALGAVTSGISVVTEVADAIKKALENVPDHEVAALAIAWVIEQASVETNLDSVKLAELVRRNIAHITD